MDTKYQTDSISVRRISWGGSVSPSTEAGASIACAGAIRIGFADSSASSGAPEPAGSVNAAFSDSVISGSDSDPVTYRLA